MGLEEAAKNSNIKVGGIAGPLAWRYHKRDPVSKGRKMIMLAVLHSKGWHMAYHSAFLICSFTHSLSLLLVHSNILLTDLIPLLLDTTWKQRHWRVIEIIQVGGISVRRNNAYKGTEFLKHHELGRGGKNRK